MRTGKDYQKKAEAKYEVAYQNPDYYKTSAGHQQTHEVLATLNFKSVLDVGCGPGYSILRFLLAGKEVMGTEVCEHLYETALISFMVNEVVVPARIQALPFEADSYDLVYCTDVLEHIPEQDIEVSIRELVRVARKYVYVSVSTVPAQFHPELGLHETVKPKEWWYQFFNNYRLKEVPSLAKEANHGFAKCYKKF